MKTVNCYYTVFSTRYFTWQTRNPFFPFILDPPTCLSFCTTLLLKCEAAAPFLCPCFPIVGYVGSHKNLFILLTVCSIILLVMSAFKWKLSVHVHFPQNYKGKPYLRPPPCWFVHWSINNLYDFIIVLILTLLGISR